MLRLLMLLVDVVLQTPIHYSNSISSNNFICPLFLLLLSKVLGFTNFLCQQSDPASHLSGNQFLSVLCTLEMVNFLDFFHYSSEGANGLLVLSYFI